MKSILALCITCHTLAYASSDSRDLSFDSDETDNGLKVGVYTNSSASDVPQIVLKSNLDESNRAYCLNIERVFEAIDYDVSFDGTGCTENCDFDEIDGTSMDLANANCDAMRLGTANIFTLTCTLQSTTLLLNFTYVALDNGDTGLEYTISFSGYDFESDDNSTVLVLEQSLVECTEERGGQSADSQSVEESQNEQSEEDEESEETEETEEESQDRRRLESEESYSGDEMGSESESDESSEDTVSVGLAEFKLTVTMGQDVCDDGSVQDVPLALVYQMSETENKIHIVAQKFECDLQIDPFVGIAKIEMEDGDDTEKDKDDGAMRVVIGALAGVVLANLALL